MKLNTTKRMKTRYDELNKSHTFSFFLQVLHIFQGWRVRKEGGKKKHC
jgi:uncharacterized protein YbdZ (MbtH family)